MSTQKCTQNKDAVRSVRLQSNPCLEWVIIYLPGRCTAVIEPGSTTLFVNLEIETKSDEQTDSKKSADRPRTRKCTCRSCCRTCNREIALLLDTPDQRCNLRPRLDVNLVFLCVDRHDK